MRVLLVGVGRWGEKHLRVLRALGADVWVADLSAERRQWALRQGVDAARVVDDHRRALGAVDAVDVVTPADSHAAIAGAALEAGRHCFVEKPMTGTVAEARRLAAAARAAGRVVQVGHVFRFHPVTATIREALAAARLGAVRYASARFTGFKRPRTDVGVTHTDAIHFVDLFAHLLGRPATTVTSVQHDFLGRGLDDVSFTTVEYGDVPVVVEAGYLAPGRARDCLVVGERGSLVADYDAGTVVLHEGGFRHAGGAWEAVETGKEELPVGSGEPLELELRAFLDACAGRRAPAVTAEDGAAALEVVEAAALSARLRRAVSIDEVR